jgi:hypothetical protein
MVEAKELDVGAMVLRSKSEPTWKNLRGDPVGGFLFQSKIDQRLSHCWFDIEI